MVHQENRGSLSRLPVFFDGTFWIEPSQIRRICQENAPTPHEGIRSMGAFLGSESLMKDDALHHLLLFSFISTIEPLQIRRICKENAPTPHEEIRSMGAFLGSESLMVHQNKQIRTVSLRRNCSDLFFTLIIHIET